MELQLCISFFHYSSFCLYLCFSLSYYLIKSIHLIVCLPSFPLPCMSILFTCRSDIVSVSCRDSLLLRFDHPHVAFFFSRFSFSFGDEMIRYTSYAAIVFILIAYISLIASAFFFLFLCLILVSTSFMYSVDACLLPILPVYMSSFLSIPASAFHLYAVPFTLIHFKLSICLCCIY